MTIHSGQVHGRNSKSVKFCFVMADTAAAIPVVYKKDGVSADAPNTLRMQRVNHHYIIGFKITDY